MKILELPFQIGEEYENWEFELEILPDRIKGLDSYKYIGKEVHNFLNYIPDKSELIFSLDILEIVILKYENSSKQLFNEINKRIGGMQLESNDIELGFRCNYSNGDTLVIYGSPRYLESFKY